jgi:hypothetical protein
MLTVNDLKDLGYTAVPLEDVRRAGKNLPTLMALAGNKPGFKPSTKGVATTTGQALRSTRNSLYALAEAGLAKREAGGRWVSPVVPKKGELFCMIPRNARLLPHAQCRVLAALCYAEVRYQSATLNRIRTMTGLEDRVVKAALDGLRAINVVVDDGLDLAPVKQWQLPARSRSADTAESKPMPPVAERQLTPDQARALLQKTKTETRTKSLEDEIREALRTCNFADEPNETPIDYRLKQWLSEGKELANKESPSRWFEDKQVRTLMERINSEPRRPDLVADVKEALTYQWAGGGWGFDRRKEAEKWLKELSKEDCALLDRLEREQPTVENVAVVTEILKMEWMPWANHEWRQKAEAWLARATAAKHNCSEHSDRTQPHFAPIPPALDNPRNTPREKETSGRAAVLDFDTDSLDRDARP